MMAGSLPKLGATLRQQQPAPAARALQADLALETGSQGTAASPAGPASTQPWPATLPEQVRAVASFPPSRHSREARESSSDVCKGHCQFLWIPAFAGMTAVFAQSGRHHGKCRSNDAL